MKRILISEDDRFMANVCRTQFEAAGYKVAVALDGHAAIEELVSQPPDVVLLDLMLPGIDGLGVLKFMRSREQLRKLPVIVVSNSSYFAGAVQEAWQAGATHFVNKGDCSPKSLVDEVEKALAPPPSKPAPPAGGQEPPPLPPALEPPPLPAMRPRKRTGTDILIADDDHLIHGVLSFFLNQAGYTVRSAFDGRQALEMAVSQAPDLLVLDGMMPELDGLQVLERWSLHPLLSEVPVIMLSGLDDAERKSAAMHHGAATYLVKPFSPEDLVRQVQRFI